jgi:hypothetical protein
MGTQKQSTSITILLLLFTLLCSIPGILLMLASIQWGLLVLIGTILVVSAVISVTTDKTTRNYSRVQQLISIVGLVMWFLYYFPTQWKW